MKLTTRILVSLFILMIAGLLASNMILKKQYDAIDKSDIYWTYNKVFQQPFKYLNIKGGNETSILYEQSSRPSVRLLQDWTMYFKGHVKTSVRNDTLFLDFDYVPASPYEKFYLQTVTPVRIFSPELLSVTGINTNFEMQKLKQKGINVDISGRSRFEVESMYPELDSINIKQSDSSSVTFEMSPDYRKQQPQGVLQFHNQAGIAVPFEDQRQNAFDENMQINSVTAAVKDHSILDIGHAQIKNLDINVSDSSAIILSGGALKKTKK